MRKWEGTQIMNTFRSYVCCFTLRHIHADGVFVVPAFAVSNSKVLAAGRAIATWRGFQQGNA